MQENNNFESKFESIINTWRRLSGEPTETAGVSMSGDSPDFKHKKKEETELLMPEIYKAPVATIATAGTAVVLPELPLESAEKPDEKQEFIKQDKEDTKEAAGDTGDRSFRSDKNDDYLDNDLPKKSDKQEKDSEKYEDNVDSVYLRPPPPHKARSNASTVEEEDCGIKCLYYTLQCCDCVLM